MFDVPKRRTMITHVYIKHPTLLQPSRVSPACWPLQAVMSSVQITKPPWKRFKSALCIMQFVVYSLKCRITSVKCAVYTVHKYSYSTVMYAMYVVQCTVCSVHCTMYAIKFTVHSEQCTVCSVQCILYTIKCTVWREAPAAAAVCPRRPGRQDTSRDWQRLATERLYSWRLAETV